MMITPDYPPWGPLKACAHCGRPGGRAWFGDGMESGRLCRPNDASLPDCYRRVTVYSEPVGALLGVEPKPAGVERIMRLEDGRLALHAEVVAARALTALAEEIGLYETGPDCG